ncbi:hypothetical protein [Persicirhabdus sediminis]|uniref:Uncharacterized protein n=1 Tax=Persicirhabdus sediminis TaxID=454144 RepID=A0A8J7MEE7_9BACT|nr:hypothetical protein [Persicirhabdus sediminis]MBK1792399.1 hypothetical protein [Persicirhabdus sediminis]
MKANLIPLAGSLFFTLCLSAFASDSIQLKNKEGKSVHVTLVKLEHGTVYFKFNGKTGKYKLTDLHEDSQKEVKKWKENGGGGSTSISITFASGKKNRGDNLGDFDDRKFYIAPTINYQNTDTQLTTSQLKSHVVLLGRPVNNKSLYHVLKVQKDEIKPIQARSNKEISVKPITVQYDDRGYATFGSKYIGYAILLTDKNNNIIASKSVPSTLADKFGPLLIDVKQDKFYDKYLELVEYNEPRKAIIHH